MMGKGTHGWVAKQMKIFDFARDVYPVLAQRGPVTFCSVAYPS